MAVVATRYSIDDCLISSFKNRPRLAITSEPDTHRAIIKTRLALKAFSAFETSIDIVIRLSSIVQYTLVFPPIIELKERKSERIIARVYVRLREKEGKKNEENVGRRRTERCGKRGS
ncbi:hypothetical protein TSAR_007345 [Trichomalopsis sarcophagae]|uniref:Uncharacterized protein n=1 Tax=Trichomalopsis sarcophagae TaxID=543379 RepID=A0A232FD26_9HYME|nr:hypothetical protein TSAR_007345 [Trichomalopsis sarcophagae]